MEDSPEVQHSFISHEYELQCGIPNSPSDALCLGLFFPFFFFHSSTSYSVRLIPIEQRPTHQQQTKKHYTTKKKFQFNNRILIIANNVNCYALLLKKKNAFFFLSSPSSSSSSLLFFFFSLLLFFIIFPPLILHHIKCRSRPSSSDKSLAVACWEDLHDTLVEDRFA